jgi:membrane protease YdiL (CAAX protease family)
MHIMTSAASTFGMQPPRASMILLSLLPVPAVWFGLYPLHSIIWTFILYHGACLLAPALLLRRAWIGTLCRPTLAQTLALAAAIAVAVPAAGAVYLRIGTAIIDPHAMIESLAARGFTPGWLAALGAYFVAVNSTVEELFWRGVILNNLDKTRSGRPTAAANWTAFSFAAWHYLALRLLLRAPWAAFMVFALFGVGLFLSWLYRQTGSLLLTILWHGLVFDLPLIVILALVLRAV